MKRRIALVLVLVLSLNMVACSGSSDAETTDVSEGQNVTLNVVTCYGGDDGNRKSFEAAVEDYEKATGNQVVDGSALSNEEWKTKVLTDFITGSEPDVLFYFTNADADSFINAGKVVSIEEIREVYPDYATNMKQSMMTVADNGKHYAVPSTGYWESLFVNKSVLQACNVEIPGPDYTWDQFLQDCATIAQAGYVPIACSLYEVPHYWFEFMVMNHGTAENHLQIPQLDGNNKLIDSPASRKWIAALEDIKMLYDAGYFPSNTLTATDAQTVEMFAKGEAAFMIDGSWKVGYFSEKYPGCLDDYVVSYVPGRGNRQASDAIGGISMGYFITRKAWENPEKQKAAVEFVFHMTSEEVLSTFITTEMTALLDGAEATGLNVIEQSAADANANITNFARAVQDEISGEAKSALFSNVQKVVTGQMTPAEAIESALKLN